MAGKSVGHTHTGKNECSGCNTALYCKTLQPVNPSCSDVLHQRTVHHWLTEQMSYCKWTLSVKLDAWAGCGAGRLERYFTFHFKWRMRKWLVELFVIIFSICSNIFGLLVCSTPEWTITGELVTVYHMIMWLKSDENTDHKTVENSLLTLSRKHIKEVQKVKIKVMDFAFFTSQESS